MDYTSTHEYFFNFTIYLSYFLYFVAYFGLIAKAPQYIYLLQTFVKIYISIYLMIKFNFLSNYRFNKLDKQIAFNAGLFLFTTIVFGDLYYLRDYFEQWLFK